MKKSNILFVLFLLIFLSCEKAVEVDLGAAESRLVVEASINWQKGTPGNEQAVILSMTTGYFASEIPTVSGAIVYITNSTNTVFSFVEEDTPGTYVCHDFVPQIDETYILTVEYDGQTYTSTERLKASPSVTYVEQNSQGGISGEDMEVKFFFDDIPNQSNFYFLQILDPYKVIPEYGVIEDRFFENNEMFGLYISEELQPGDVLTFRIYGVSQDYFNYMDIMLEQAGTTSFGPFATPTSTVRGNIINQTDFDNYALGFFRLSETDFDEYTIQ